MPRKSLAKSEITEDKKFYQCILCKKSFTRQRNNFPPTQSNLFAGNTYYLPWCWSCVERLYKHYNETMDLGDREATRRVCSKFDIYWSDEVYEKMRLNGPHSIIKTYINRTCLNQHAGKTYDNTIEEEAAAALKAQNKPKKEVEPEPEIEVPSELIAFWGRGFDPEDYFDLQASYDRLTDGKAVDDPATIMLVKQACLSEVEIANLKRDGKPYEKQQASLMNTLGGLNLKPSQVKDAEKNSGLDSMPLGVGIQHWEQTRPLPDIDPSWEDVDRIAQYMMTWYTGASMRMFDVDNEYTQIFNDAIDEYKVERPDLDDETDDKAVVSYIVTGGDKSNA